MLRYYLSETTKINITTKTIMLEKGGDTREEVKFIVENKFDKGHDPRA